MQIKLEEYPWPEIPITLEWAIAYLAYQKYPEKSVYSNKIIVWETGQGRALRVPRRPAIVVSSSARDNYKSALAPNNIVLYRNFKIIDF